MIYSQPSDSWNGRREPRRLCRRVSHPHHPPRCRRLAVRLPLRCPRLPFFGRLMKMDETFCMSTGGSRRSRPRALLIFTSSVSPQRECVTSSFRGSTTLPKVLFGPILFSIISSSCGLDLYWGALLSLNPCHIKRNCKKRPTLSSWRSKSVACHGTWQPAD